MDPLSVTASVIAVIQIASVISTHCMNYVKSARNTKSLILRLVQELGGLQIVLRTLEELTQRGTHVLHNGEDGDAEEKSYLLPTLHKLCQLEYVFEECLRKLEQLERDIMPTSQANLTKKESFLRALHWPLKEAYMRNIMDDINHYISLFSLALSLDETDNILEIREKTFETHLMVKYLHSQKDEEIRREHGDRIVKWLSAPNASVDHTHALRMKTENTGSWLLDNDKYQEWKRTAGSSFWMYGIAGCGKTILSSTVIEDLTKYSSQDMSIAVAYFYFKGDENDKNSSSGMLRALLKQLFESGKRTSNVFEQLIGDGDQQASPEQLLSTLRDLISEFRCVYIVLDALDECQDLQDLFDILEEFEKWTVQIHLILTSRELKDIRDFVESMNMDKTSIRLSAEVVKQDIRMYIRDRLRTDRNLKRWRNHPKVQEEIEQNLIEKSGGMFQWVRYQLISLVRCRNPPELRRALETMPKGLNDTYAQILSQISDDDYESAIRILSWLLFSLRPLSVEELAEVVALNLKVASFDDIERLWDPAEVLNICPNLLTTIEEYDHGNGAEPRLLVRLAHISIREYLLSSDVLNGNAAMLGIREPNAHALITNCCLTYMSLIKDVVSAAAESLPLAIYAVENWLYHYEKVPESMAEIHELALNFFVHKKEVYSRWVTHISGSLSISKLPIIHSDLVGPGSILPSPLEVVCHNALLTVLKLMLENKEVDIKNEQVLKDALRAAYLPTVLPKDKAGTTKILLQYGADFTGDGKFATVLNAASYFGLDDFVQKELYEDVDVNARGGYYETALQAAVAGRHDRHFFEMSRHFWPTRWPRPGYILEQKTPTTIQILLKHGADPNICGGEVGSSLLASCYNGDLPCVKLLLAQGADPTYGVNGNDDWKKSCLAAACRSADIRIVKLLMNYGARADNLMALCSAVRSKDIEIIRHLLENGANPNSERYQDETPLQIACFNEQPKVVELLLQYGASISSGGGRFGFPLQLTAATFGSVETLKVLVANGANVNQRGGAFGTSLHTAAHFGDVEMVYYLISQGADVNAEGVMFKSVLRHALGNAYTDIFVLLLKKGADMQTPGGRYGETLRQMLAAVPENKSEIWFKTFESANPQFPSEYLCAVVKKGDSWQDIDHIVVDDRGNVTGIEASEWDCVLTHE